MRFDNHTEEDIVQLMTQESKRQVQLSLKVSSAEQDSWSGNWANFTCSMTDRCRDDKLKVDSSSRHEEHLQHDQPPNQKESDIFHRKMFISEGVVRRSQKSEKLIKLKTQIFVHFADSMNLKGLCCHLLKLTLHISLQYFHNEVLHHAPSQDPK